MRQGKRLLSPARVALLMGGLVGFGASQANADLSLNLVPSAIGTTDVSALDVGEVIVTDTSTLTFSLVAKPTAANTTLSSLSGGFTKTDDLAGAALTGPLAPAGATIAQPNVDTNITGLAVAPAVAPMAANGAQTGALSDSLIGQLPGGTDYKYTMFRSADTLGIAQAAPVPSAGLTVGKISVTPSAVGTGATDVAWVNRGTAEGALWYEGTTEKVGTDAGLTANAGVKLSAGPAITLSRNAVIAGSTTGTINTGNKTLNAVAAVNEIGTINVGPGGSLVVAPRNGGGMKVVAGTLNLDAAGGVNLNDGGLVLRGTTATAVRDSIAQGFNADGTGIYSTQVLNDQMDPNGGMGRGIGYANYHELGPAQWGSYMNLRSGDVLVKTTYFGDADLNGKVDGDDFTLFLAGLYKQPDTYPTWIYGDFDYSGEVNGDDFTLFLAGLYNQGATMSDMAAFQAKFDLAKMGAVPEPASVMTVVLGATIGLLARRRSRRA